jgi:hypothetical protein
MGIMLSGANVSAERFAELIRGSGGQARA